MTYRMKSWAKPRNGKQLKSTIGPQTNESPGESIVYWKYPITVLLMGLLTARPQRTILPNTLSNSGQWTYALARTLLFALANTAHKPMPGGG